MNIRQENLRRNISANVGSLSSSARKSGYSESYVRSGRIQKTKHVQNLVKDLVGIRQSLIEEIQRRSEKGTLGDAHLYELVGGVDKLTDKIQLLSGKPTDIQVLELVDKLTPLQQKHYAETGELPKPVHRKN